MHSESSLRGLKIIILQQGFIMGGAERQGLYLAQWLQEKHGVSVEVWGLNRPGPVSTWCDANHIPWRLIPWPWNVSRKAMISGMFRLFLEIKRAKPDVLLPYTMPPNIVCGLFWNIVGAKACIWNQRDDGFQRFASWLERRAIKNTPYFISNSSHAAEFMVKELGARQERVAVIYNGIELAACKLDRSAWRKRLGIPQGTFVACMVAHLNTLKDHSTLLRAWHLVCEAGGDAAPILLLAGHDYGTGIQLKALSEQLGITDQVLFLGQVDDIPGLLNASDLGVFSSFKEGLPNGVLECMATGLPVVATDIPGIREALGDDYRHFLSEPQNPTDMAVKILPLFSDQGLRQSVGQRNIDRIRTEFIKERMCERYCELIVNALSNNGQLMRS